jgi:putative glutamine amidotransferase
MLTPVILLVGNELPASETPKRGIGHLAVSERYTESIHRAGGRALVIPATPGAPLTDADELLEPADGLLLIGGGDIDPARYGQSEHVRSYGFNRIRDELELRLASHAIEHQVPLFAICRGCQVVNVATGGTLHQHLSDLPGISADTHGRPHDLILAEHPVVVEPASLLEAAVGGLRVERCTSAHHQSVDKVGDGLRVTGRAEDGCIEALELDEAGQFFLAVQWHPEMTAGVDEQQQGLFDAFVLAAGGTKPHPRADRAFSLS